MPSPSRASVQPLIDVFEPILVFFHDTVGVELGPRRSSLLTIVVRALLIPLTLKQFKSMQALPAARAGDQGAAGEVQGRQAAPEAGDDEVLPGEQGQPVGLLPAAGAQMPVFISLFYMLRKDLRRDICGQAATQHVARRPARSRRDGQLAHQTGAARLPLHPGPHEQGHRRRADRPDRPLRRLAAALERADAVDRRTATSA